MQGKAGQLWIAVLAVAMHAAVLVALPPLASGWQPLPELIHVSIVPEEPKPEPEREEPEPAIVEPVKQPAQVKPELAKPEQKPSPKELPHEIQPKMQEAPHEPLEESTPTEFRTPFIPEEKAAEVVEPPVITKPAQEPAEPEQEEQPTEEEPATAAPAVDTEALLRAYGSSVFGEIIGQKYYPDEAERRGVSGSVKVAISISRSGSLLSASVRISSGSELLDNAALQAVRDAAPFSEIPAEAMRESVDFTFTLEYKLR